MKRQPKASKLQLNLALRHPAPMEVPTGKERELALALAELLLTAADEVVQAQAKGGEKNESKVDS